MSDSQVPFATLGNAIGFISKLSGSVTIQSIDGQERVVKIGDPIFFGETVVTGANSSVTIAFIDGTEVVIGGDSVVEITDEIYNSGDNQDLVADSSTDIDALQNAILAGDDPTLVQDAPAAGETQGEQQRVDVDVQRTGALGGISGGNDTDYSSSLPGFGYDTNGQGSYGSRQENVTTTQQNTTRNSSSDTTTSDTSVSTPTISLATSSDTGESNSDLLTNDTTATFTLSNIDSDVVLVQIYNGDTLINSTTAVDGLQTFTAEVGDLTEGTNSLTIKVTDSSGNTSTSSPVVVTLDTVANEGTVTVNAITSDDVINANEAAGTVTVTGTATGGDIAEGDAVTMTINGNVYNTTVDASGNWSVDVAGSDLAADTEFDVVVTSSDDAGNTVNSVGTSTHTVDVDINGRMSISDVTSDDIISAAEAQGTVAITGIVSGDVKNGDIVTLTVNGKEYSGSVTNRLFSIDVAGSDLAQDSDRRIDATITLSDNAGNILVVTANSNYQVDTTAASAPTVSIVDDTNDDGLISKDELGNNNVQVSVAVNAADLAAGGSVTLSIGNGDSDNTVTLTAGDLTDNATYSYDAETGTITWTESVAEGAQITVTATQTDAAGNESGTGSDSATLDTTAASAPGVTITEDVNDNGYISAAELDGDVNVTISLTGTNAVEGDKLTVNGETITLTAAQIEAGEVLTTVAAPAEGATLTVETTITDKAGNVSEKGSDSAIMDTSVSGLTSDITDATNSGSNDDTITNDATPDISGVTEAGATVTITYTDAEGQPQTATGTADANGNYTIAIENALPEGSNSLSIKAVDVAGNESTTTQNVTVDTSVSGLTSDITDATNSGSNDDTITNDATPDISGVTEAGATVTITYTDAEGQPQTATGTADANGNYTIAIENALPEGSNSLSIKAVDVAGNESTTTQNVTVDTSVSGLTSDITDATNSGSNDDTITNDATPDISGVTEAGATVTITYTDAEGQPQTATGTADANGNYTIAIENALPEGSNSLSIKAVDVAGNESTTTQNVTVDTSVSGLTSDITDATNSGSNDDTITNDATPDISGVTEAGATVTITYTDAEGQPQTATGTADANGNYTIAIENALPEGSNSLSIKAVDVAGNESTTTQNVTVDTSVSGLTSDITDATNSGSNDDTITNDATPDISGVTEAGATVTITYTDAEGQPQTATGTADANGNYTIAIENALPEGSNSLSIKAVDVAGNESTTTQNVTVDTSVSGLTSDITDATNSGSNDDTITNDATPDISGVTEAGATVTITYTDAEGQPQTATGTADANGNYTIAIENALPEGSNSLSIKAVDVAGNESTTTQNVTVDNTAPVDGDGVNTITFETNGDIYLNKTESGATNLAGKVELGATVVGIVITDSANPANALSVSVDAISVDSEGNVSVEWLDLASLVDGSLTVSMSVVDSAGNEGNVTNSAILDTTITAVLYFDDVTEDDIVNAIESQGTVTLTGIFAVEDDTNAKDIVVTVNGHEYTVKAEDIQSDGGFSLDVTGSDLASDSDHKLQVTAEFEDDAGNTIIIETGGGLNYSVDLNVALPVITNITDDSASSDYSKVTLHGTGEVGAVITLWVIANSTTAGNDTQTGEYTELTSVTTTVSSDGTWSLDVSSLSETPVNDNEFFKVTQTDTAGNVSGDSNIVHYWHGDWTSVSTETGDDFVLLGSGNDTVTVDVNDDSDSLTVDGGAGNDKAVFSSALSEMQSITLDDAGNVVIVDDQGDTNTFIDFESFSFDGVVYSKEALFAPHAHDDEATTDEDSAAITIDVLANDVDFDSPTLTITGADVSASQGTVTIVDGKLEFTPAANFNGEATITYSVSDGTTTDTATVSVTVNAVDDAVDAVNDSVTVAEDGSITLNLIDNDSAPDGGLEVTAINGVELTGEAQTISVNNGSVVIAATGEMTFEPAADFSGDINFDYDVKDTDGSTDTATVSVTVNAVADAPIITESSNSSSPGIAYSFWSGVYAGDANGDGVADFDGNGASVEQLTALLESTQNTKSSDYSGVIGEVSSINGIQQGTLAVATTYVYLEAGSSYSFSGNADDSFYVKVGGDLVAEAQWDNGNTAIESSVLTVSESGYYPVEIAYHNQNGDGFINLAVSINGGDSQVFGTDSFSMYPTSGLPRVC
ncbi:hypothetical protein MACH16_12800 [Marinomonas pontica]|uniref:PA14 domain-containing protein n=2 Tax=Marinomonas TaxID=28253 RepID=A0ABN6WL43_9GAMM|nr:hypothetical protein MACH16_12800 [Marinomonas pontica]